MLVLHHDVLRDFEVALGGFGLGCFVILVGLVVLWLVDKAHLLMGDEDVH